jgi:A-factor biosynthesis hotdog domain
MNTDLIPSRSFQPDLGLLAVSLNPVGRRLDKRLVHKSYDENVLVSHIEAVQPPGTIAHSGRDAAPDRMDHFRATLCINRDHPLFFDRDCGHVHAICLMEAAQQTTIAIAHLFYDVPLDVECVQTECSAQFRSIANIDDPLIAEQTMSGHVYRRGRLVKVQTAIVFRQGNLERVRIAGTIVLLKNEQLKYLEERASVGDLPKLQSSACCS